MIRSRRRNHSPERLVPNYDAERMAWRYAASAEARDYEYQLQKQYPINKEPSR